MASSYVEVSFRVLNVHCPANFCIQPNPPIASNSHSACTCADFTATFHQSDTVPASPLQPKSIRVCSRCLPGASDPACSFHADNMPCTMSFKLSRCLYSMFTMSPSLSPRLRPNWRHDRNIVPLLQISRNTAKDSSISVKEEERVYAYSTWRGSYTVLRITWLSSYPWCSPS